MGGYGEKVAKQFVAPKLFFYTVFWGLHFFLFGYGWYALSDTISVARRRAC